MPRKFFRKNKNASNMSVPKSQVSAIKKIVNKTLNKKSEVKQFSTEQTETALSSATAVYVKELSQVTAGDGRENRDGIKINPIGNMLKYTLYSDVSDPTWVRVILFLAPGTEGNSSADKFLLDASASLAPVACTAEDVSDIISPFNKNDFNVLYDRTHYLDYLTVGRSVNVRKFIKLKGSRTFASLSTPNSSYGNLRMLVLIRPCDGDTVARTCEMNWVNSYYFKDM